MPGWSPEQISRRLKADFPEDESMRISHEATLTVCQAVAGGGHGAGEGAVELAGDVTLDAAPDEHRVCRLLSW
jgi:hypothetical protein